MLTVTDLDVYHGDIRALKGVSFSLQAGEVLCLLGRNGAGKTTALRAIMGLLPAGRGAIRYENIELTTLAAHDVPKLGIGYVPQGRRLFAAMTVRENLEIGLMARGGGPKHILKKPQNSELERFRLERFEEKCEAVFCKKTRQNKELDRFGDSRKSDLEILDDVFDLFPPLKARLRQVSGTLSGGEQQMLAIARALCLDPSLILMDEPTEGLMPSMITTIRDVILRLRARGKAVLLVEQRVEAVLSVADRVAFLQNGQVAAILPVAALRADPALLTAYVGVS